MGPASAGLGGVTMQLWSVDSQGKTSAVSGVGPTQTLADGSYKFSGLAAGNYEVQIEPSSKLAVGTLTPGTAGGTSGTNDIQLSLADAQAASGNDFAITGPQSSLLSLRMYLASTGTPGQYLKSMHSVPTVATGDSAAPHYSATFTTGGAAVAIAAADALITASDSPTLASMTVSIANPLDGSSETLAATTTGTPLTASYAGDTLSITGVADIATYDTVLRSVKYQDSLFAAHTGVRTISVVVNDGTRVSQAATSTITVVLGSQSLPVVTTNPAAATLNAGGTTTFTAAASGTPAPTAQWQVDNGSGFTNITNGGVYSGSATGTLTITGATAAMNGYKYQAIFTNSGGSATSTAALLTVDFAPTVTTSPTSQTVNAGSSVTFTAAASSNPAATVQWAASTDGGTTFSNIAGATSTSYTFTTAAGDNGKQFEAVFTDSVGSTTSTVATLTVDFAPTVTTSPASQTINAGSSVTFTAATSGNPAATVQWMVSSDGGATFSNIAGATSASYSFTAAAGDNAKQFEAVFTNSAGTATSTAATLTVNFAPTVTTSPTSQTVNAGSSVTFTAAASSNPAATVQWMASSDGSATFNNIAGATSTTYTFTAAAGDNGKQFEAVFTDSTGTATSNPATLTVDFAPTVTTSPTSRTVSAGSSVTFTAAASSNPAATVQWMVSSDGGATFTNIAGATSASYTFTAAAADNGKQFEAVFTDSTGTATSNPATLTVDFAPTVTTSPTSQTVNAVTSVTFTAAASGNPAATVQWMVSSDGGATFSNIAGATTTSYSFTVAAADDGEQFEAVFTNSEGTTTSNPAMLTVSVAPTVSINPTTQSVAIGSTVSLTAAATSNPTASVQWQVNTGSGFTDITDNGLYVGSSTGKLTINGATADVNGYLYRAVFTNSAGTATTSAATLTVDFSPTIITNPASQLVNVGDTASFTAAASSSPAATVQWQVNTGSGFANITDDSVYGGSSTGTLTITGATAAMNGYEYEAVFTNGSGSATTTLATLTVAFAPTVTTNPSTQTASGGSTVTFTAAASGSPAATVQWQLSTDGGATFTDIAGATSSTYSFTALAVDNGFEYQAVFTNSLGSAMTTAATLHISGYLVTADQTLLGPSNDTTAGFSIGGVSQGDTYSYSVTSDGGAGTVTGSGTVTSTTPSQDVTVDVSSLPGGTLTYSVEVTHGNITGNTATAMTVLDKTAPSGYTITGLPASIDNASAASVSFTINSPAAENGDTFNYTIVNSSDPSKSVTGSGAISATAQSITGINVSSLANGTLTFSVTLSDSVGNVGLPVSATATLSQLAITSTPATTATVGQVYTYTIQTNADAGDTLTVTPGLTLPAGMNFDAPTNTFTWTPTADQAGTTQSFSATVTDTTTNNTVNLGPIFVSVAAANGLTVVAPASSVASGSPVLVSFQDTNAGTPTYTITTSSTNDPAGSNLTATLLPESNQVLKIVTDQGEMDFQLFNNFTPNTVQHFVDLVNSGTYNTGGSFYRIIQTFMDQGGVGGSGTAIPDELNANLRFTSSGLLSMANNGVDGNTSEFFITNPDDMSDAFLDFRYTIFGKLISGDNVRAAIAAKPVTTGSSGEDSQPLTPPKILSMSVVNQTSGGGVLELQAAPGASGPYTVTVSDGLGGSQSFTVNIGTNSFDPPNPWVDPINGNDKITTNAGTPVTFTPQGESADGSVVQVEVQTMLAVTGAPAGTYVDNSFLDTTTAETFPAQNPNANITVTQNGSSYTVTPAAGFYGVQVLEVTGLNAVIGTFQLQVGSTTTAAINFNSTNLAATATNIKNALVAAGFSGTTVSVDQASGAENLSFNVTFAASQADISYSASSGNPMPIAFANSAAAASVSQMLTFTATGPAWDAGSGVNPVYRAFVPVFVNPPAPEIGGITSNGQSVNGSTSSNNSSPATAFSFDVTGAVAGAVVSVYMDGSTTPIATGTVAAGATTITLTTDGATAIGSGPHTFVVKQSIATSALNLYADWSTTGGPSTQFTIPASTLVSDPSLGVAVNIN